LGQLHFLPLEEGLLLLQEVLDTTTSKTIPIKKIAVNFFNTAKLGFLRKLAPI
jgi:hypothetical protein